jgi:hypothetical protein
LPQTTPLSHLREYVKVLRPVLWEGKVDHHGHFYVKRFADVGFPLTAEQTAVSDGLVDSLIVSRNEATVAARFTELLVEGLDELMVSLVPIKDAADEQTQLMHLIGQL